MSGVVDERRRALRGEVDEATAIASGGRWLQADDVYALVRRLDVALNGEDGAAKQATLSDIVGQVEAQGWRLVRLGDAPELAEVEKLEAEWLAFCKLHELEDPWTLYDTGRAIAAARKTMMDLMNTQSRRAEVEMDAHRLADKVNELINQLVDANGEITELKAQQEGMARFAALHMSEGFAPTHRHVRRGTLYQLIGTAKVQTEAGLTDNDPVRIYRGADGELWTRPIHEFEDDRFEVLR